MSTKPYHHGNLKNALIEAGIDIINNEGEKALSLRKVAARCGVSQAAPYSHFENKEALLSGMRDFVAAEFVAALEAATTNCPDPDSPQVLLEMSKSYVMFFVKNPQYFSFLFSRTCMVMSAQRQDSVNINSPAFDLFKETAYRIGKKHGYSDETIENGVIQSWAMVHGISAIATMKNVYYDNDWQAKIPDTLRTNFEDKVGHILLNKEWNKLLSGDDN